MLLRFDAWLRSQGRRVRFGSAIVSMEPQLRKGIVTSGEPIKYHHTMAFETAFSRTREIPASAHKKEEEGGKKGATDQTKPSRSVKCHERNVERKNQPDLAKAPPRLALAPLSAPLFAPLFHGEVMEQQVSAAADRAPTSRAASGKLSNAEAAERRRADIPRLRPPLSAAARQSAKQLSAYNRSGRGNPPRAPCSVLRLPSRRPEHFSSAGKTPSESVRVRAKAAARARGRGRRALFAVRERVRKISCHLSKSKQPRCRLANGCASVSGGCFRNKTRAARRSRLSEWRRRRGRSYFESTSCRALGLTSRTKLGRLAQEASRGQLVSDGMHTQHSVTPRLCLVDGPT